MVAAGCDAWRHVASTVSEIRRPCRGGGQTCLAAGDRPCGQAAPSCNRRNPGKPRSEQLERGCHGVRILWCQVLVVQEHFDSGGHLGGAEPAEAAWRASSRVLGARRPASLLEAAEERPVDRGSRTAGWPCDAPAGRVVAPASLVQQRESGSRGTRADQGVRPTIT